MTTFQSTTGLIEAAQGVDTDATNKLLKIILEHHMPARTRKYRGKNILVDDHDIESAFMVGCFQAIPKTKLTVGNPLSYILWKGQMAVADLFEKKLRRGVRTFCATCGHESSGGSRTGICDHCGSERIDTRMVALSEADLSGVDYDEDRLMGLDTIPIDAFRRTEIEYGINVYSIELEEIRSRLNGRVLQLFDILVVEEVNRESSQSYLKEIAERWNVSTACVAIYLRKLRTEIVSYIEGD